MPKLVHDGGTAKTTTVTALGVLLARGGTRTHVIDMDHARRPFAGLSAWPTNRMACTMH